MIRIGRYNEVLLKSSFEYDKKKKRADKLKSQTTRVAISDVKQTLCKATLEMQSSLNAALDMYVASNPAPRAQDEMPVLTSMPENESIEVYLQERIPETGTNKDLKDIAEKYFEITSTIFTKKTAVEMLLSFAPLCLQVSENKNLIDAIINILKNASTLNSSISVECISNLSASFSHLMLVSLNPNENEKELMKHICTLIYDTLMINFRKKNEKLTPDLETNTSHFINFLVFFYKIKIVPDQLVLLTLEESPYFLDETLVQMYLQSILYFYPLKVKISDELQNYLVELISRIFYKGDFAQARDDTKIRANFKTLLIGFLHIILLENANNISSIENHVFMKLLANIVINTKQLDEKMAQNLIEEALKLIEKNEIVIIPSVQTAIINSILDPLWISSFQKDETEQQINVSLNVSLNVPLNKFEQLGMGAFSRTMKLLQTDKEIKPIPHSKMPEPVLVDPKLAFDQFEKELQHFADRTKLNLSFQQQDDKVKVMLMSQNNDQDLQLNALFTVLNKRFKTDKTSRSQYLLTTDPCQLEINTDSSFFERWTRALRSKSVKDVFFEKPTKQESQVIANPLNIEFPVVQEPTLIEKTTKAFNKLSYGASILVNEESEYFNIQFNWPRASGHYVLHLKHDKSIDLSEDEVKVLLMQPLKSLLKDGLQIDSALTMTINGVKLKSVVENGQLNSTIKNIIKEIRERFNAISHQAPEAQPEQPILQQESELVLQQSPIELLRAILGQVIQPGQYAWLQENTLQSVPSKFYSFKLDLKSKEIKCLNKFVSGVALIKELVQLINNTQHFKYEGDHLVVSKEWFAYYEKGEIQLDHVNAQLQIWINKTGITYDLSGAPIKTIQPQVQQKKGSSTKNYTPFFTPGYQQAYRTVPAEIVKVKKLGKQLNQSMVHFEQYAFPYDAGHEFESTLCAVFVESTLIRLISICSILAEQCGQTNKALFLELKKTLSQCRWDNDQANEAIRLFSGLIESLPNQAKPQEELAKTPIIQSHIELIKESAIFKSAPPLSINDLLGAMYLFSTLPLVTDGVLTSELITVDLLDSGLKAMYLIGSVLQTLQEDELEYFSSLYSTNDHIIAFFDACKSLQVELLHSDVVLPQYYSYVVGELNRFRAGSYYDSRVELISLYEAYQQTVPIWGL